MKQPENSHDEVIDIFNLQHEFQEIGLKSVAHCLGLWHNVFQCWIVNAQSKVLLQLRSKQKSLYPFMFDVSAAGHLASGEKPLCGVREIKEELGISVYKSQLRPLFKFLLAEDYNEIRNREFAFNYLLEVNVDIQTLTLQQDEVDGVFEVTIDDFIALLENEKFSVQAKGILKNSEGIYQPYQTTIRLDQFVPHDRGYYLTVVGVFKEYLSLKK